MQHIKAPVMNYIQRPDEKSVFLAGAIDMGQAEPWHDEIVKLLQDRNVIIFNPRRDEWNSSWKQEASNPQFAQQVNWELDHIQKSDYVIFYFPKDSKAPISFLELGLAIGKKPCIIYVHPDFYRKGNIDIVANRHGVKVWNDVTLFKAKLLEIFNV